MTDLSTAHEVYKNEPNYIKNLKRLEIVSLSSTASFAVARICLTLLNLFYTFSAVGSIFLMDFTHALFSLSEMWNEIHYFLEQFVLFTFITVLYNLLKCLNASITEVCTKLANEMKKFNNTVYENISVEQVHSWVENYQNIVNCSKEISSCFKYQVNIFSLVASINCFRYCDS